MDFASRALTFISPGMVDLALTTGSGIAWKRAPCGHYDLFQVVTGPPARGMQTVADASDVQAYANAYGSDAGSMLAAQILARFANRYPIVTL